MRYKLSNAHRKIGESSYPADHVEILDIFMNALIKGDALNVSEWEPRPKFPTSPVAVFQNAMHRSLR